jgi:hypothetical protein
MKHQDILLVRIDIKKQDKFLIKYLYSIKDLVLNLDYIKKYRILMTNILKIRPKIGIVEIKHLIKRIYLKDLKPYK